MSILLNSCETERSAYLDYAQGLMVYFVRQSKHIYSDTFVVYNVHNLIHLCEDVISFKCSLNDVSAFQYENYLQILKKFVRKAQNPIAQVTKRFSELEQSGWRKERKDTVAANVSTKRKDSCFLLRNEKFAFVKEKQQEGKLVCDVYKMSNLESFFKSPCDSKLINVAFIQSLHEGGRRMVLDKFDLVCLPYKGGFALFPTLHGVEKQY